MRLALLMILPFAEHGGQSNGRYDMISLNIMLLLG